MFPRGMGSMASNDRDAHDNQHAHKLRTVLNIALSAALADGGGCAARRSIRARLLGSASGVALSVASVVVALGVCVPGAAQAQTTVNPVQTTTFTLNPTENPIIFGPTTNIDTSGTTTNAVDGNAGTAWSVTNNGTLLGGRTGVFFDEAGSSLTNSKSISGATSDGVQLFNGGTVVNQVGGTISGLQIGVNITKNGGAVTNAGTITAQASGSLGIFLGGGGTVNNQAGGTISGDSGIFIDTFAGTVTSAGTISGSGGPSVIFLGTGTNTLTLQTGSVLNGDANGSLDSGATNNLILEGQGAVSNIFREFHNLDVQASGTWVWNNNSTIGATTITSGTLAVDGTLGSPVTVNAGGALAGRGTVNGDVSVAGGGAVAPGAAVPFSNLTVTGNVTFSSGSIYRVNVNAGGQNDKLSVTGIASLQGTVNVLAQNGTYAPSTTYTILSADGGLSVSGDTFTSVNTNLAFLTPLLSSDANDLFLTLVTNGGGGGGDGGGGTGGGFGFATVAQTRNQAAVATSLDGGAVTNPLVIAILN